MKIRKPVKLTPQATDFQDGSSNNDELEFIHLQLTQAIETFRMQFNLLVQILTVFVIADVSILGYAISIQSVGIIMIAAIIPLFMIVVIYGASRFMIPILYTAIVLEDKYPKQNTDWLMATYLSVVVSTDFVEQLRDISQTKNHEQKIQKLRKQRLKMIDRRIFDILLLTISLTHLLTSFVLIWKFNWKIF